MQKSSLFTYSRTQLIAAAVAAITLVLVFQRTFVYLYANWQREEYSHGFLIPLISIFLLWQRRAQFRQLPFEGSWWGVALVIGGLLLFVLGSVSSVLGLDGYALVIVVAGAVIAAFGWKTFRLALLPIALLLLMIPIPTLLYNNLSSQLQLISSQIGVAIIRALGVSVYLEGNVIDLGNYKLQVAEACSGLRYLFPLMTLGAVVAFLFRQKTWMRWCIFLSTIPIAVLMNSFRIGVIGLLVDRWGIAQAEGFLHQFEGWVIFMACFGIVLAECLVLHILSRDTRPFREVLGLEAAPNAAPLAGNGRPGPPPPERRLGWPAAAVALVMSLAVYPAVALPQRTEIKPVRNDFTQFPSRLGEWTGRREQLERIYLDELQLDDYLLANFGAAASATSGQNAAVNLYVAYYASQRSGQSVHSPRSCLPGGGWRIQEIDQRQVAFVAGRALRVNRALIQQGSQRQLVYYWFQERGRDLTNEYLVKWYLFADALTRNRSDGALVRVMTRLEDGEGAASGDARLSRFSTSMLPVLDRFIPQ